MNPLLAAGLFDNPWIVAAILIIGAFVNWLSRLRQQKQQREEERDAQEAEPGLPEKPPADFDMEATLRRLLGEDAPKPTPAPPPLPRAAGTPPPPPIRPGRAHSPQQVPPPVSVALPMSQSPSLSDAGRAALRFEQLNEQGRHPEVAHALGRRSRPSPLAGQWRNRESARRAFVASLVFGPPKGLES